jgi:hypothetical protein
MDNETFAREFAFGGQRRTSSRSAMPWYGSPVLIHTPRVFSHIGNAEETTSGSWIKITTRSCSWIFDVSRYRSNLAQR